MYRSELAGNPHKPSLTAQACMALPSQTILQNLNLITETAIEGLPSLTLSHQHGRVNRFYVCKILLTIAYASTSSRWGLVQARGDVP